MFTYKGVTDERGRMPPSLGGGVCQCELKTLQIKKIMEVKNWEKKTKVV